MALWDQVTSLLALKPKYDSVKTLQARTISDLDQGSSTINDLLLRSQGIRTTVWRAASVREAMGQPAIFRAVSLIANTVGSLGVEAYRNGLLLPDDQRPRLVTRPDPFRTPRGFYRDSAYHLATRGECWWWIAKRDVDDQPLSLILMPPWEVTVTQRKDRDRLHPTIKWLDTEIPRDDVRLITFMPDDASPSGPFQRGVGPLQLCGAALSVAVESTEWAANWFAGGGRPPLIIKSATDLGDAEDPDLDPRHEADILREQWMDQDNNTPRVIDPGIEDVIFPPESTQSAQMNESRNNENGNAARMFGIPGDLLEYSTSGSSLHYQNDLTVFIKFVKTTLAPNYLEPMEQELSDLLTRSTIARFNVKGFLRADPLTRAQVYEKLVPLGVVTVEEAREDEGYAPGDVEFAPVPFAPPQAVPDSLPIQLAASQADAHEVRCRSCNQLLAELAAPPYRFKCRKCKAYTEAHPVQARTEEAPPRLVALEKAVEDLPARIIAGLPRPSEQPAVTFGEGAFRMEAPEVNIPSPVVNVPPAEVTVTPAPVDLQPLHDMISDTMSELVREVRRANLPKQRDVRRGDDGRVIGLTEWTVMEDAV
jgi:HK97 family phage portal protein